MEPTIDTEQTSQNTLEKVDVSEDSDGINIYPIVRHIFLTLCILLAVSIILFLIYQNGRIIYDKGI